MIKISDLKVGDVVLADYEGKIQEVVITQIDHAEKLICCDDGIQEYWYPGEALHPIELDDEQLMKMNFEKQLQPDGSVKYMKGPFRILLPREGEFGHFEIWYREDIRHINQPLYIHQLQNHYLQMTKVELARD